MKRLWYLGCNVLSFPPIFENWVRSNCLGQFPRLILGSILVLGIGVPSSFAGLTSDMQTMAKGIEAISPLIFGKKNLSEKERQEISQTLEQIEKALLENGSHFKTSSIPYAVNFDLLKGHLAEARQVMKEAKTPGTFSYAKGLIKAIPLACANCHTSDARVASTRLHKLKLENFESPLEFADFLFTTRQYKESKEEYLRYLKLGSGQGSQILHAFKRIILSSFLLKEGPRPMMEHIEYYLKVNRPNLFVRDRLQEWLAGLRKLDLRPEYLDLGEDWKNISSYIQDRIVPLQNASGQVELVGTEEIYLMNLVGNLGRYLNGSPKREHMAEALYWFALAERSLYDNIFFSLSDLLLKSCVQNFGEQSYARKCLKEYEDQIIFAYTGSRGTDLPPEVQKELKELREYLARPAKE